MLRASAAVGPRRHPHRCPRHAAAPCGRRLLAAPRPRMLRCSQTARRPAVSETRQQHVGLECGSGKRASAEAREGGSCLVAGSQSLAPANAPNSMHMLARGEGTSRQAGGPAPALPLVAATPPHHTPPRNLHPPRHLLPLCAQSRAHLGCSAGRAAQAGAGLLGQALELSKAGKIQGK